MTTNPGDPARQPRRSYSRPSRVTIVSYTRGSRASAAEFSLVGPHLKDKIEPQPVETALRLWQGYLYDEARPAVETETPSATGAQTMQCKLEWPVEDPCKCRLIER